MFSRMEQISTNAGFKVYSDGIGYNDYSIRLSNFSINLNNAKQNLVRAVPCYFHLIL